MKVYLAGPISGLSYEDSTGWRDQAVKMLDVAGHTALNPMVKIAAPHTDPSGKLDWQVRPWPGEGSDERLVHFDLEQQVLNSDAVLLGLPTGYVPSVGTAVEIGVAYAYGVPIVVWNPHNEDLHPFIGVVAQDCFVYLIDAVEAVIYNPGPLTFEAAMGQQLLALRQIMLDRQRKYGPKNIEAGGVHGLITRMEDKMARIKEDHPGLVCGGGPCSTVRDLPDEGPLDAYRDIANYGGVIYPMFTSDTWGLPLIEDTFEKEDNHGND